MKKTTLYGSIVIASVLLVGSYAVASGINTTITACAKPGGEVVLIGTGWYSAEKCQEKKGSMISWNTQGPKGDPGAPGHSLHLYDNAGTDLGILVDLAEAPLAYFIPTQTFFKTREVTLRIQNDTLFDSQSGNGYPIGDEESFLDFIYTIEINRVNLKQVVEWGNDIENNSDFQEQAVKQVLRDELRTKNLSQVIAELRAGPKTYIVTPMFSREKSSLISDENVTVYKTYNPTTKKFTTIVENNVSKTVTTPAGTTYAWPVEIRE